MRPSRIYLLSILLLTAVCSLSAQSNQKNKLQQSKKKIEEQIRYNDRLLNETKKNKQQNINKIQVLNSQIKQRDRLIQTINQELFGVARVIDDTEQTIIQLTAQIKQLKLEYVKMLKATQKNVRSYDRMMFVLASEDFQQAYRRMKYFQQYSAHRKNQVRLIGVKQKQLEQAKQTLEVEKKNKTSLLTQEQRQRQKLDSEKEEKDKLVKTLSRKEKNLRAEIAKKQKEADRLDKQIQKIIEQEMERARKEAARKAAEAKKAQTASGLSSEDQKLSNDFAKNRGKLPWPCKGSVTSNFGVHQHEVYKNVKSFNNGIDITCLPSEEVKAVFEGVVVTIYPLPNSSKVILLRHGGYLTVYVNVVDVKVSVGNKVSTGQTIGTVFTEEGDKTILNFQLWKEKSKENPALWLRK